VEATDLDSSVGVLWLEDVGFDSLNASAAFEETVNFGSRGPLCRK